MNAAVLKRWLEQGEPGQGFYAVSGPLLTKPGFTPVMNTTMSARTAVCNAGG